MKRTISAMVGKGSVTHNSRSFTAENVDSERTHLNIDYCNEPIKKVYHEMFDEALKQYNDKQKRKDRKIPDYYKHIESGKQEKLFHEIIFQIGKRHLRYIKQHHKIRYTNLLTSCKLTAYLADIDDQAEEMFFRLVKQLAEKEGVTEQLKANNQMLWVKRMNNIRNRATEIVNAELIYV